MSNLIAIGTFIGTKISGSAAPGAQNIISEASIQMITEGTSQNMITE